MSAKLRAIIIDDERPARLMIGQLIANYHDEIEVIAEAENGVAAIQKIKSLRPDVIFLDIEMPGMNGFEVLAGLENIPMVVFTTAYEQYAVKAFNENALDYLVKPIDHDRFALCIDRLVLQSRSNIHVDYGNLRDLFQQLTPKREITALPVKLKDKILLVRLSELTFLEAGDGYVSLIKDDGKKYLSDMSLTELEEKLPANFIRVQKSIIINKDKIAEIAKYFNNRLILTMTDKNRSRITTGTSYIKQIRIDLNL